jgi:hypothetical protein
MRELEMLGAVYGVPAIALTLDPVNRKIAEQMIRAHRVISQSEDQPVDEWLRFGETMLTRKPIGDALPPRKPQTRQKD